MHMLLLSVVLCFCAGGCSFSDSIQTNNTTLSSFDNDAYYNGLSLVAPPRPFTENPMPAVRAIAANSIAIIPYAYTRPGQPHVYYDEHGFQWWGERPEGYLTTLRLAKAAGLQVLLKPQVYIPGSWPGELDFVKETDWERWEKAYEAYILPIAIDAEQHQVELFCIGTEFKISVKKRTAFWRQLIQKVRQRYSGKIVYSANWDSYHEVPFWDALDYIGISAYFPLSDTPTPSVEELVKAWEPTVKMLAAFQQQQQKQILFTEYGYLSVDGCAGKNWELERELSQLSVNQQAQANALEALYQVYYAQAWWAGGFLWKWFPNMEGHEGYIEKDYTPQNKKAAQVLLNWYQSSASHKK